MITDSEFRLPDRNLLLRGYLAAFFTLVTWTGFSLVSRVGGKSPLTPYDIIALRLITASLALLPIAWGKLPAGAWRDGRLWILSLLGNLIYCLLVYRGFKYAPAAHGAILLSTLALLIIGTLTIYAFDPCPAGAPAELLPSFCPA